MRIISIAFESSFYKTSTDYSDLLLGMAGKETAASAVSRLVFVVCDFPAAGSQISTTVRRLRLK